MTPRRLARRGGLPRRRASTSSSSTPPRPARRLLFILGMARWGAPKPDVGRTRTLRWRGRRRASRPPTVMQFAWGPMFGRRPPSAALAAAPLLTGASTPRLGLPSSPEVRAATLLVQAWCTGGAAAGLAGGGRVLSLCTACLPGPWRGASPPVSASGGVSGGPPANASSLRTPMAGARSYRRSRSTVLEGHARPAPHRLLSVPPNRFPWICKGSASTASPPPTGWQPAGCLHAASAARSSGTLHGTASSDVGCLLQPPLRGAIVLRAVMPWFVPMGRRTLAVRSALVEPRRPPPPPPLTVGGGKGRGDASVGGTAGGRLSPRRQPRLPHRLLPKLYRPGPPKCHRVPPCARPRSASLRTDPLAEAMCAGDGPPALVVSFDPMLEELLAAAFVVSCSVEAPRPGFAEPHPVAAVLSPQPSAQELAQLTHPREGQPDVEAGDVAVPSGSSEPPPGDLAVPSGSTKPPPVAAIFSPQSSAQELAQLTPPRAGQPDIELGDETLTRLARFLDEVRVQHDRGREPRGLCLLGAGAYG